MDKDFFIDLYLYNFWANMRVWECIEELSDEEFFRELSYSIGSIHSQIMRTLSVEAWWFRFLQTGIVQFIDEKDLTNRDIILKQWVETEKQVMAYLNTLTTEELNRKVLPPFWENKPAITVRDALVQVANHSTDHRAQTLSGLHQLGATTIEQDYLFYLWEKETGK
ncbi:MAG TPA: DinB family protein [Aggregatilineales bacterium]|nr:DinB family protein [Aggregatilineales bacterium]